MSLEDKRVWYSGLTVVLGIIWVLLMFEFKKFDATWWNISVYIIALPATLLIIYLMSYLEWFRNRWRSTSWMMVTIILIGFALSAILGVYFTEPIEPGGESTRATRHGDSYSYDYGRSRSGGYYYYYFGSTNSSSSGSSSTVDSDFDLDLDDGGEGITYLFLIVLVLVLILASAFVPHFWVLATLVCVGVLGLITWREFNLEKRSRYSY